MNKTFIYLTFLKLLFISLFHSIFVKYIKYLKYDSFKSVLFNQIWQFTNFYYY